MNWHVGMAMDQKVLGSKRWPELQAREQGEEYHQNVKANEITFEICIFENIIYPWEKFSEDLSLALLFYYMLV